MCIILAKSTKAWIKVEVELTRPVGGLQLVATVEREDGLLLGHPQVLGDEYDHDHDDAGGGGAGEDVLLIEHLRVPGTSILL